MKIKNGAFKKTFLMNCKGFSSTFIGNNTFVDINKILPTKFKKLLPEVEGNKDGILHYTKLSVLYNRLRKVPFVSAYNIDGGKKANVLRANFKTDPRIPDGIQLSKRYFYDLWKGAKVFEIGHMAANNEMAWGKKAQIQAYQTFHFPNSVPQAKSLNTGLWRTLESYIIKEAIGSKFPKKISVFTGPVLSENDPVYTKDLNFKVPLLFYKVIVFPTKSRIYATGFLMSHEKRLDEMKMIKWDKGKTKFMANQTLIGFINFPYKRVFQVDIKYLESLTGLSFSWKGVSALKIKNGPHQLKKIRKIKNAEDAAKMEDLMGKDKKFKLGDRTMKLYSYEKGYKLNMILP